MSLPSKIAPAILDTVLAHLAILFLTGAKGDPTAARQAAAQMLATYHPRNENELRLAAEIISFGLHALEALSQAATPDMPLAKILRLRGSAVSLSRESHKAQRKLDQLQKTEPAEAIAPQPEQPRPKIEKAIALIEATRDAPESPSKINWTQSYQQRQAAQRITENLKKNQATHAASLSASQ